MTSIRVALVEDNAALRGELARLLGGAEGVECVAACGSAEEALERIPAARPDVVLVDIQLPGQLGTDCVPLLCERVPGVHIMMLTSFDDPDLIFRSIAGGATGYLLKETPWPRLLEAIRDLHAGGSPMTASIARHVLNAFRSPGNPALPARGASGVAPATPASGVATAEPLTPREQEVLDLIARGRRIKEVAAALDVSPRTVDGYLQRIYLKLHVRCKAEAVAAVRRKS